MSSQLASGAPSPLSATPEVERYEIERLLGRGGFGEVYLARYRGRQGFTRRVALKVLRTDVGHQDDLARRVRDEARLLGLVHHRAVVGVDRLVQIEGRSCIVMEYVDGVSLDALVRASALPVGVALEIAAELCRALHVCSTSVGPDGAPLRLLHRDIKPSNVLLTRHGDVKLLDFGIAHAAFDGRESETRSLVFGTPGYMAPERFELLCGAPADIYALGVVLFEILTRRRFGRTSGNPSRHAARLDENLALLADLRPDATVELSALLRDLLAFDPLERPTASVADRRICAVLALQTETGLRGWAEAGVAAAQSTIPFEEVSTDASEASAGWTGRVVTEDRSTLGAQPVREASAIPFVAQAVPSQPVPAGRRGLRRGGGVLLVLLLVLLGFVLRPKDPGPEEPPAPPIPVAVPVPLPPTAPVSTPPPVTKAAAPPKPKPRSAKATCAPPKVLIDGSVRSGIEVNTLLAGWQKIPACVDWRPVYDVRHVTEAGTVTDTVTVGAPGTQIAVTCDAQRCRQESARSP